jgi:hypothetical protein
MTKKDREGNTCIVQSFKFEDGIKCIRAEIIGGKNFLVCYEECAFPLEYKYKNLIYEFLENYFKKHVLPYMNKSIID